MALKYEEVYLHAYDSVSSATAGLGRYLTLYNTRRPHSSLTIRTLDDVYFSALSLPAAALYLAREGSWTHSDRGASSMQSGW